MSPVPSGPGHCDGHDGKEEQSRVPGQGLAQGEQEQQGGVSYLQQHDVIGEGIRIIVWVGEGPSHGDDLLGPLLLRDVVGPQGDAY